MTKLLFLLVITSVAQAAPINGGIKTHWGVPGDPTSGNTKKMLKKKINNNYEITYAGEKYICLSQWSVSECLADNNRFRGDDIIKNDKDRFDTKEEISTSKPKRDNTPTALNE